MRTIPLSLMSLIGLIPLHALAASTTQPTVHVRDVAAQTDSSTTLSNNGNLYLSQLPVKWTLDYDFGLKPGHTAQAVFSMDGGKKTACYQPPYCPENRAALGLGMGTHTIALTVNGTAIPAMTFTIANAPPVAVSTVQIAGQMGTNAAAVNDPMLDLTAHPQYMAFIKASNLAALRVWTEGSWTTHQPANYYHLMPAWHDAGVKVILVANFQNSSPRCSCPSDADWTGWLSAIPPPAVTGAWAIEVGNEVNTKTYFTGTSQQLSHLMQIGYPILHDKGYVLIAPSTLNSTDEMKELQADGAYQWCDYVNTHSYRGNAAQVAADVDAAAVIAAAVNKPLAVTEWGTRPANATPTVYAASQASAITALLQRPVLALQFPFYVLPGNTSDTAAPFSGKGAVNQPFYDSIISAAANSK